MGSTKSRIVLVGFVLVLLVAALAGCGGDSSASKEELNEARQQGAAKARQQAKIQQIQKELKALKHGGGKGGSESSGGSSSPSPAPEGGSVSSSGNCGGSLSVNEYTTCGFAENVEAAYYAEIGSGSGTVSAYSPAKNQYYSMYCTAGSPHECTGGNNAAVYFP